MQQYFLDESLSKKTSVKLRADILYHLRTVLRANDGYEICLVDQDHQAYRAKLLKDSAQIIAMIRQDSELDIDVTVILSLFKNERFDFCLQKLTELGVKRIVPYMAERSIIKIKDPQKKLLRYHKIVMEASEQSRRLYVPEIMEFSRLEDLDRYKSSYNFVAYEKEDSLHLDYDKIDRDITYVIGPEGGFTSNEIDEMIKMGYEAVTLGKRILRAETAALYVLANIGGHRE